MQALLPTVFSVLVFGSVFFMGSIIASVLSRALEQYRERYVTQSTSDFGDMFLFIEPRQMLVMNLATMGLLGVFGFVALNTFFAVLGVGVGFFLPMLVVHLYRARRLKAFNTQLVDALQAMSNALKAGLTFPQAMENVAREAKAPLSQEFGLFVRELRLNLPIEDALTNMARRVRSDDLDLVVLSTNISRQLGGNLAEMYETLSGTIRERFRLEGKVSAMTSQGKLQGWVLAAMPLAMGLMLRAMRPDLVEPMLEHIFGWLLIAGIIVMEAIGILWIRRIVNIDA